MPKDHLLHLPASLVEAIEGHLAARADAGKPLERSLHEMLTDALPVTSRNHKYPPGTVVISVNGELNSFDDGERHTGPNAEGYIDRVDEKMLDCYRVVFPLTGHTIHLSDIELEDSSSYVVTRRLADNEILGIDINGSPIRWVRQGGGGRAVAGGALTKEELATISPHEQARIDATQGPKAEVRCVRQQQLHDDDSSLTLVADVKKLNVTMTLTISRAEPNSSERRHICTATMTIQSNEDPEVKVSSAISEHWNVPDALKWWAAPANDKGEFNALFQRHLAQHQRSFEIQNELRKLGLRMEPSLNSLDGDGDAIVVIVTGEQIDPEELQPAYKGAVLELAEEWSILNDQWGDKSPLENSTSAHC